MLQHKKIVLGVCGSIAAYKSAYLIRELVKRGAEVKVIMTASASDFIHPLTLATLSKNPVLTEFITNEQGEWNNHVELGLWADLMIIAPTTANTIGKLSNGLCDNLLCATYLSARCEVMIAPAMDLDMYEHPSVVSNIERLVSFGNQIIEAEYGELASGLIGKGRMSEPEHIVEFIETHFKKKSQLVNKNILITAGPTYEALDPVRFIGNHSSGKMGFALAKSCLDNGAQVTLVSGPTIQQLSHENLEIINVSSAEEMLSSCLQVHSKTDISIFCAAVADYRPKNIAEQKIKKSENSLTIELIKNPDIASELGKLKKLNQIHVGFALETNNEEVNAAGKLKKKNFDMIVLNSLNDSGAGFKGDTNKISIIEENNIHKFELKSKTEVAKDIVNKIIETIND